MDNFLTHIFSIKNHPICELKEKFRVQYVMGLGEFMYCISKKDSRAKLVYIVWARSIVKNNSSLYWQITGNCSQIREVLSLKRDGFRFFSMRRVFYFDCFYLVVTLNPRLLEYAFDFLHEQASGIISRKILKDVYNNWGKSTLIKIPYQLLVHKKENDSFHRKPLKRILVVATMSAGKSTLINALMGYRVNDVKTTACTNKLCYLYNKPAADGIIIKSENGGYLYSYDIESIQKRDFIEAGLHFNSPLAVSRVCFIDSPGANFSDDKTHGEITRKAIASNDYEAIIFVVNSLQFNTDDEANLREYVISKTKKPVIFVLNQLDYFNPEDDSIYDTMKSLAEIVNRRGITHEIVPLSAYYALLLKIGRNRLSKQEQIQEERLKRLFQYDYYNLPKYYRGNPCLPNGKNEIAKTGITILEKVICTI